VAAPRRAACLQVGPSSDAPALDNGKLLAMRAQQLAGSLPLAAGDVRGLFCGGGDMPADTPSPANGSAGSLATPALAG
jgi:hypothetical protein